MIAKLKGILDSQRDDAAVIDVGGVGYLIYTSSRTLTQLGDTGGTVSVFVETHVREDHIHLYGFASEAEHRCFGMLQTIQGVGARAALAILSALSPEDVVQAVLAQDRGMLTRANGVGPKLAGRIVNELKDRAAAWEMAGAAAVATAASADGGPVQDAVSALVNLGYNRSEAYAAVAGASQRLGSDASLDRLIAASLQDLGS